MNQNLNRRLKSLEAARDHGTNKRAAELTDAELCHIAGVPLDVTDEELQRIADGSTRKERQQ